MHILKVSLTEYNSQKGRFLNLQFSAAKSSELYRNSKNHAKSLGSQIVIDFRKIS
jgi:hypothetical protein